MKKFEIDGTEVYSTYKKVRVWPAVVMVLIASLLLLYAMHSDFQALHMGVIKG